MKLFLRALALTLALPSLALANDYMSENPSDWFRYKEARTNAEVTARMDQDLGGWRNWSEFGGMGSTWVYTGANHDWLYLYNGRTYTLVGNLSGAVGSSEQVDMPSCNRGAATIASRGPLQTAVGTFSDVTEVRFQTSCADAGTSAIWFAKGFGIVKWTESSFAGERTFEVQAASVDGRRYDRTSTTPAPTSQRAVAPAEHARMEAILWGCNDTYLVLDTYRDAFRGLNGSGVMSQVVVASQGVASQLRYELAQFNVPMDDVEILVGAVDSVWMRDYGPIILRRPNGERVSADPDYYPNRPNDDDFPAAYASYRGWDNVRVAVGFEGGNFATDGREKLFCTNGVQWFNRDLSRREIEREFQKFGLDEVHWFEPLIDEGTTHIDMFLRIMGDDTALVSRYPRGHKQYAVTNEAASKLTRLGYRVTRVDVDHRYDEYGTYSNSVLANGIALVPQYEDAAKNRAALQAYRDLGFRAVGIDARLIIKYAGATHCVSMQVPAR